MGKYVDDPDVLGKYSNNYLIDNFEDYRILREASKIFNLNLPNCTIIEFDQEPSEAWEMSGLGDVNLPGVVCNSILDFLADEQRFDEVSLFIFEFTWFLQHSTSLLENNITVEFFRKMLYLRSVLSSGCF